jgi:peptidoglycan/LPS O-acetylase OafA/YrhL
MTKPKHYVPALDAIRGVAILGVFLFHALGMAFGFDQLPWKGFYRDFDTWRTFLPLYPLTYGSAGVAVFFVVSGFCIHLSFATSSNQGWMYFANRRFFRIYPPYLFVVLFLFFAWPWGGLTNFSFERIEQLASHLFAIHNLNKKTFFGINPSFWSIAVELQLYAIYPILVWLIARFGWGPAITVTAIFELSIRAYETYHLIVLEKALPIWITASPFAYWLSWSMGAFVAKCYLNDESSLLTRVSPTWLAIIAFGVPLFKPTAAFGFVAFAFLTSAVIAQIISGQIRLKTDNWFYRHLSKLGVVSFSFYLIHQPILYLYPRFTRLSYPEMTTHPILSFTFLLLLYPIIFWLSKMLFNYVEMPSVSLGRLIWRW